MHVKNQEADLFAGMMDCPENKACILRALVIRIGYYMRCFTAFAAATFALECET